MKYQQDGAAASPSVLVVGTGSVGTRHINNLLRLGADVSVFSYRVHAGASASHLPATVRIFTRLDDALASAPAAVVVANKTDQHLEVALRAAELGCHLFIEKPLSHSLRDVATLVRIASVRSLVVEAGFMLRFHPNLQWLFSFLQEGGLGDVHYARAAIGQYLPEWRPGTDYRQCYSAQRPGGGVIFDLAHELDLIGWLFGPISELFAMTRHSTSLQTDTEAVAQIGLRVRSGLLAQVHLDCLRPVYSRTLEIVGSRGIATWDYGAGSISLTESTGGSRIAHHVPIGFERNDMFLAYMQYFLRRLSDREVTAACSLDEGIAALRAALACHQSSMEKRMVSPLQVSDQFSVSETPA